MCKEELLSLSGWVAKISESLKEVLPKEIVTKIGTKGLVIWITFSAEWKTKLPSYDHGALSIMSR